MPARGSQDKARTSLRVNPGASARASGIAFAWILKEDRFRRRLAAGRRDHGWSAVNAKRGARRPAQRGGRRRTGTEPRGSARMKSRKVDNILLPCPADL